MKLTKKDWTERTAAICIQAFAKEKDITALSWRVTEYLRRARKAERQRAVRVCHKVKQSPQRNPKLCNEAAYNQACDDCAAAIRRLKETP